ncbi:hypothetical protein Tco_1434035, partial [Tanacetum coccineum]
MYVDHMSQPWRTLAVIINKYLYGKTTSNDRLRKSKIDIMWGMFYRENVDYPELIWEDFAYQIDHKRERKSRLRVIPDVHQETVDVSEESESEPAKKKTASRRVVKKKVTISTDDNIIPSPNVAFELGKSISSTEATEEEAKRQVHASHETIVTESVPNPTRRRPSEEQEEADIMQALKESKKTSKRQQGTRGLSEGTGTILGVPNESTVVTATSSEGTCTKLESEYSEDDQLDDEEKDDKDGNADDEGNDHISDTQDAETESDVDEIYKYKICMHKDVDAEMEEPKNVEHENKEKDVITDAAKLDVEKLVEETGDAKKAAGPKFQVKESTEFPLPSSSCFHCCLLTSRDTYHFNHATTTTPIPTPPITTESPTITTAIPESDALFAIQLRVVKLEKDVSELKKMDLCLEVKSVSVKKLHGYGHLEKIVVKRADSQLYKFKEGDFVDLHLNDIEDTLLLDVQYKLFHLIDNDIVDFIVALRIFTRS